jgi:hypothetical protein
MKTLYLLAAVWAISGFAFAGGQIGGGSGGFPVSQEMSDLVLRAMQPDLGLEKIEVPLADFRRINMRLSSSDETSLELAGASLTVKKKDGGIIDTAESRQLLPK